MQGQENTGFSSESDMKSEEAYLHTPDSLAMDTVNTLNVDNEDVEVEVKLSTVESMKNYM